MTRERFYSPVSGLEQKLCQKRYRKACQKRTEFVSEKGLWKFLKQKDSMILTETPLALLVFVAPESLAMMTNT